MKLNTSPKFTKEDRALLRALTRDRLDMQYERAGLVLRWHELRDSVLNVPAAKVPREVRAEMVEIEGRVQDIDEKIEPISIKALGEKFDASPHAIVAFTTGAARLGSRTL